MNDTSVNSALYRYGGCIVPFAAVIGTLLILGIIGLLLGDVIVSPKLEKLPGLPDRSGLSHNLNLPDFFELSSRSFLWLFFVFTVWVAASIAIITSFVVVHLSFVDRPERNIAKSILSGCLVSLGIYFWLTDASFISAQDIIQYLKLLAPDIRDLIETTTALALLSFFAITVSTSMLLFPPNDKSDIAPKMQRVDILLYVGAAVLVAWILQSRALYGFGAASLVSQQQLIVDQVAPIISLAVGGVFSIVSGLMYVCSYLWLINRYESLPDGDGDEEDNNDRDNPGHFFRKHWTAVLAAAGPMLPGLIEMLTAFGTSS
jgi:hypothetical protein